MSEILGGSRTSFGRRFAEKKAAHVVPSSLVKTMVVPFHFDDLAVPGDALDDATYGLLPANAQIITSYLYVEEAFVGGTDYDIGLYEADGTVITTVGIDNVLVAALTANTWIPNNGSLVNGSGIGPNAGQVIIAPNGVFTSGRGKIVIEYLEATLSS